MKIVININNSTYETIKHEYCTDPTQKGLLKVLRDAIKDGTPLPKGHGRLIDVNDLLDRIGLEDNDTNRKENVGEIITLEDFDYTPTIIEADKTESEG